MCIGIITNNRKTLRLPAFDYAAPGTYFITLCTYQRHQTLCRIGRGGALFRPFGRICKAQIQEFEHRFNIQVDKYVIMPNHLHMLLSLADTNPYCPRAEQSPAPTTISEIICAFKSIPAKQINAIENTPGRKRWQRSFYDHVVRTEKEYLQIWTYIDNNPLKWELDRFYESE